MLFSDDLSLTLYYSFNQLAFQAWCGRCDVILSKCADVDVTNIFAQESDGIIAKPTTASGTSPNNLRQVEPSQTQRRSCNYLQVLARAPQSLSSTLSSHPYDMPNALFQKLRACHDIQSLVRRLTGGGIHFDSKYFVQTLLFPPLRRLIDLYLLLIVHPSFHCK